MVAKGLDFENVTLVGVLAADLTLYMDLLLRRRAHVQLADAGNRAGGTRRKGGRAVIQTYTPENEVLQCAAQQDYDRFCAARSVCAACITIRLSPICLRWWYPVRMKGAYSVPGAVLRDAMKSALQNGLYQNEPIQVVGPAPAPVAKVNNCYRYHVYLVAKNHKKLPALLWNTISKHSARPEKTGAFIFSSTATQ